MLSGFLEISSPKILILSTTLNSKLPKKGGGGVSAPMYMMTLLSMLQARPLKFVKQFRTSRIAERPVSVAKKITVLSSANDSTLSVSRLDSKEKGSLSLVGKR